MSDLKPCSSCGREAWFGEHSHDEGYMIIKCFSGGYNCLLFQSTGPFKEEDLPEYFEAWNNRPIEDAFTADNDRLREAIKYMLDPYPESIFPNWPDDRIKTVLASMTDEQKLYLTNSNGVQSRHVVNCILTRYDELTKEATDE